MAGAGPTVLVRATDVTTVYIDECPYEVVERQVTPAQAPLLEQPGRHIIQIAHSAGLQFEVEHGDYQPLPLRHQTSKLISSRSIADDVSIELLSS